MTRGKTEKIVAIGLASVAATVGRLAMDCCLIYQSELRLYLLPGRTNDRQQYYAA